MGIFGKSPEEKTKEKEQEAEKLKLEQEQRANAKQGVEVFGTTSIYPSVIEDIINKNIARMNTEGKKIINATTTYNCGNNYWTGTVLWTKE